jgi:hypothetical protein
MLMSDKMALRQIIEIAAAALAEEEGSEEIEMGGEDEMEDEAGPAAIKAMALRIRNQRDAE